MAKVMISLPDSLLMELDQAAKGQHKKRSEFIKDLALQFLRGPKAGFRSAPADVFDRLREYTFELERGETAEGLIREMRDQR